MGAFIPGLRGYVRGDIPARLLDSGKATINSADGRITVTTNAVFKVDGIQIVVQPAGANAHRAGSWNIESITAAPACPTWKPNFVVSLKQYADADLDCSVLPIDIFWYVKGELL